MTDTQPVVLEMRAITKEFPGVRALDGVTMAVRAGQVHAVCGENGAGKSTLMKILSGVHPHGSYGGTVLLQGQEVRFKDIKASERAGVVIIHQELALIPELSIAENIFLGNEVMSRGLIDWDATRRCTSVLLARVGLDLDPATPVKSLGVGQQQLVEIAKALSKDVRLLILDEPTSALNEDDSANLLALLRGLQARGITSIIISHKLNEIAAVADAVTVLRDGRTVETYAVESGQVDEDRIIRAMVGRSLENRYPHHTPSIGETILEVRGWQVDHPTTPGRRVCKDSAFHVRSGEIVGFAGLMGAGRTELARSVFGRSYGTYLAGEVLLHGRPVQLPTVEAAIRHGLAYVPEDRKNLGLNLLDTIRRTITSADLRQVVRRGLLDVDREGAVAEGYRRSLRIKSPTVDAGVTTLSGGNQQKVVLAKWMFPDPDVLILDEPTRGIDVGAKYEIYQLVQHLADQGKGVVVISSELPELLGLCDRIYTICEGRVTGVLDARDADQESLMRLMTTSAATTPATATASR
ncbi:ABC transporter related protein [Cellulomonas flavigena DSM 20109]|uniref:ABC transporter related protein n=1 Tax=Cellulomonas flavigena (strain ATCC 482 / DSM 20109 / BCRC 11376 / JCM 18109 / NBRC 3775 / NCIMB 8073 / NRS 134) TaxID=446466 RepID=D5UCP4_CELFN|nr:multiple monosaccharide ABC transporter ATP-binding protein [Cellulomonas flavigena]ADG76279.1 ABC transporter related protein [Cellulomonas flavigena DSM 20109]